MRLKVHDRVLVHVLGGRFPRVQGSRCRTRARLFLAHAADEVVD